MMITARGTTEAHERTIGYISGCWLVIQHWPAMNVWATL